MEDNAARIRFAGIEIASKNMLPRPMESMTPPTTFHHDITAISQVNPQIKLVLVTVNITIREDGKDYGCFSISVICAFEIENFDVIIKKLSEGQYHIPPDIDAMLKSVSVSTARGIIYSELRGTFLFGAILPIVIFTPDQVKQQHEKEMTP
jgi:hypothetical protein